MNKIITVLKDGTESVTERAPDGLQILWMGDNAFVKIHESVKFVASSFQIASGSFIEINENSVINNLFIRCAAQDSSVKIGKKFICHKSSFILAKGGKNQSITIGDDCLLAANVDIYTSDGHTIYDSKSEKVLNNKGGNIVIGNHCWIGKDCMLSKSASLANDTIVGAKSLVNKKFDKSKVILAGSPAKIIKKNVNWDIRHPDLFEMEVR